MPQTNLERRKHPRASFRQNLLVQTVSPSRSGNVFEVKGTRLEADAQDISEGGFGLKLAESLKPGSILKVTFRLKENEKEEAEAYVRVVWTKEVSHGVQFLMLEDGTRRKIRGFIETTKPKG